MSGDGQLSTSPQVVHSTPSVGSSGRPEGNSRQPLEASLDLHVPLTEAELLEGYGVCGRCSGSGSIGGMGVNGGRRIDCPRCDGTGRKGGTR